jgi:glutamate carboxypeptidase
MSTPKPADQLRYFQKRQKEIVETIRQLVELESPSDIKQSVDRVGTVLASRFGELGAKIKGHAAEKFGKHLQIDFRPRGNKTKPVLLLGHMDTVHPVGTISKMPCRVSKGRVWGPGVLDMKAGIALALHVIEALLAWNDGKLPRPATMFFVSDEEVGSASSRPITEKLAREAAAVLVLEPAYGLHGAVKTARKGVGEYILQITGVAAHSGLDFEKGQSAIIELAHQILEISKLVDPASGVTLNVGKISGGTRTNVVAPIASASIDVRVSSAKDIAEIDRKLTALKPVNPHCSIAISGRISRPPLERTEAVAGLYIKAREIARGLGFELGEAAVGGGSDGNLTAALGIPTLDGLGAVGEGAHAEHELVVIADLPRRAALLAGLIQAV